MQYNRKILHPEDRVVYLPIKTWIDELIQSVKTTQLSNLDEKIQNIAWILNQASLVLACCGDTEASKELCKKSIQYYQKVSETTNPYLITYVIQPWINLGRLERIVGNFSAAYQKFIILIDQSEFEINRLNAPNMDLCNIIIKAIPFSRTSTDVKLRQLIEEVPFSEMLKTALCAGHFQTVFDIFPLDAYTASNYLESIILEGVSIAQFYQGEFDELQKLLLETDNCKMDVFKNIFRLRLIEFYIFSGEKTRRKAIKTLLSKVSHLAKINFYNTSPDYIFTLIDILLKCEQYSLAYELVDNYRKFNNSRQDEVLEVRCLKTLLASFSAGNRWSDTLAKKLENTGYVFLREDRKSLFKWMSMELLGEIEEHVFQTVSFH